MRRMEERSLQGMLRFGRVWLSDCVCVTVEFLVFEWKLFSIYARELVQCSANLLAGYSAVC
jgi:hypothetical protein